MVNYGILSVAVKYQNRMTLLIHNKFLQKCVTGASDLYYMYIGYII